MIQNKFKNIRSNHYNMKEAMARARQLMDDEDEDEDEDQALRLYQIPFILTLNLK